MLRAELGSKTVLVCVKGHGVQHGTFDADGLRRVGCLSVAPKQACVTCADSIATSIATGRRTPSHPPGHVREGGGSYAKFFEKRYGRCDGARGRAGDLRGAGAFCIQRSNVAMRFDVLVPVRLPGDLLIAVRAAAGGTVSAAIRTALAFYVANVYNPHRAVPPSADRIQPVGGVAAPPPAPTTADHDVDALLAEILR